MVPADNHVHSEWSYDTTGDASMRGSCERALALGVPAVAFTEHLDFTTWREGDPIAASGLQPRHRGRIRPLDVTGYLAAIEECRQRYPGLRVLSGVETGEPHLFAASAGAVIGAHRFDRVLGSLHAVPHGGQLTAVTAAFSFLHADEVMRRYFAELLALVEGSGLFGILAHMDFPRRYWPAGPAAYSEIAFEEEYRAVFRALAASGRVLEVNTKSPLASAGLLRWWREEGGRAVSFGSDAHADWRVGDQFKLAADVAESAGFRPGRDRFDFWRR
ncbi:MAG TPA: PHP domain-containing protein [Streptosporangiaceae bacterium]|nr:PHP domain-containing protein [Streptosporangiaceae bacterium]